MRDGNVAVEKGVEVLHTVLTVLPVWRVCILLTHLLLVFVYLFDGCFSHSK